MTRRRRLASLHGEASMALGGASDDGVEAASPPPAPPNRPLPPGLNGRAAVVELLRLEGVVGASRLVAVTGVTRQYLAKLAEDGAIRRERHGRYALIAHQIDSDNRLQ